MAITAVSGCELEPTAMCECVDHIRFVCVCVNVWITLIWLIWISCNSNLACCTCFIICPFFCWSDAPDWSDAPGVTSLSVICVSALLTVLTCSLPMQSDMFTRNVRPRIEGGERSRIICAASREEIFIALDVTDGLSVRSLSAEFRGDREIGLAAVRRSSRACQYLTVALRADKEFGLAAVTANGCAVEFLSVELRILFALYLFSEQLCRADVRSSTSLSADVSLSAENERRHCASMLKFHRILVMPPSLPVGVVSAKCCISLSPGAGDLDDANQWIYAPEAAVLFQWFRRHYQC